MPENQGKQPQRRPQYRTVGSGDREGPNPYEGMSDAEIRSALFRYTQGEPPLKLRVEAVKRGIETPPPQFAPGQPGARHVDDLVGDAEGSPPGSAMIDPKQSMGAARARRPDYKSWLGANATPEALQKAADFHAKFSDALRAKGDYKILAAKAGLTRGTIGHAAAGRNPSPEAVRALAPHIGLEIPDWFPTQTNYAWTGSNVGGAGYSDPTRAARSAAIREALAAQQQRGVSIAKMATAANMQPAALGKFFRTPDAVLNDANLERLERHFGLGNAPIGHGQMLSRARLPLQEIADKTRITLDRLQRLKLGQIDRLLPDEARRLGEFVKNLPPPEAPQAPPPNAEPGGLESPMPTDLSQHNKPGEFEAGDLGDAGPPMQPPGDRSVGAKQSPKRQFFPPGSNEGLSPDEAAAADMSNRQLKRATGMRMVKPDADTENKWSVDDSLRHYDDLVGDYLPPPREPGQDRSVGAKQRPAGNGPARKAVDQAIQREQPLTRDLVEPLFQEEPLPGSRTRGARPPSFEDRAIADAVRMDNGSGPLRERMRSMGVGATELADKLGWNINTAAKFDSSGVPISQAKQDQLRQYLDNRPADYVHPRAPSSGMPHVPQSPTGGPPQVRPAKTIAESRTFGRWGTWRDKEGPPPEWEPGEGMNEILPPGHAPSAKNPDWEEELFRQAQINAQAMRGDPRGRYAMEQRLRAAGATDADMEKWYSRWGYRDQPPAAAQKVLPKPNYPLVKADAPEKLGRLPGPLGTDYQWLGQGQGRPYYATGWDVNTPSQGTLDQYFGKWPASTWTHDSLGVPYKGVDENLTAHLNQPGSLVPPVQGDSPAGAKYFGLNKTGHGHWPEQESMSQPEPIEHWLRSQGMAPRQIEKWWGQPASAPWDRAIDSAENLHGPQGQANEFIQRDWLRGGAADNSNLSGADQNAVIRGAEPGPLQAANASVRPRGGGESQMAWPLKKFEPKTLRAVGENGETLWPMIKNYDPGRPYIRTTPALSTAFLKSLGFDPNQQLSPNEWAQRLTPEQLERYRQLVRENQPQVNMWREGEHLRLGTNPIQDEIEREKMTRAIERHQQQAEAARRAARDLGMNEYERSLLEDSIAKTHPANLPDDLRKQTYAEAMRDPIASADTAESFRPGQALKSGEAVPLEKLPSSPSNYQGLGKRPPVTGLVEPPTPKGKAVPPWSPREVPGVHKFLPPKRPIVNWGGAGNRAAYYATDPKFTGFRSLLGLDPVAWEFGVTPDQAIGGLAELPGAIAAMPGAMAAYYEELNRDIARSGQPVEDSDENRQRYKEFAEGYRGRNQIEPPSYERWLGEQRYREVNPGERYLTAPVLDAIVPTDPDSPWWHLWRAIDMARQGQWSAPPPPPAPPARSPIQEAVDKYRHAVRPPQPLYP